MAKVSLTLDTRGKDPHVKLLISGSGKSRMVTLGIRLDSPEQWDQEAKDGPIVGYPGAKSLNAMCRSRLRTAKEILAEMELQTDGKVDIQQLANTISLKFRPEDSPKVTGELTKMWTEFSSRKEGRTFELYHETKNRIIKYTEETGTTPFAQLNFDQITVPWLERFDAWMSKTRGVNARAIDMRNLRSVCMYAWKMDLTHTYVFKRFKIKRDEHKEVKTLTDDQFQQIFTFDLYNRPDLQQYRDIALLGVYLIGINIVDMHDLTRIDADGYIRYRRAKTHRQYCIKVEPEALEIIERYRGDEHLLSWADRYSDHKSFAQHLNEEGLKRIGPSEVVSIPGSYHNRTTIVYHPIVQDITYYWLRRYWATTAYSIGISIDTIAAALGHGRRTVTDVYIRKDQRMIDEANRRVIAHIQSLLKQP